MDLVKIGGYIAAKRKALGLTQKQLAEQLGMSDKSVSKWERGVCLPDVSVYAELCGILGISLNEFLAGEDICREDLAERAEDNLIQVTRDSRHRIRNLKGVIALLVVVALAALSVLGMLAYRHLKPQNYVAAVDRDSPEMRTARLLSGMDGAFLFAYAASEDYQSIRLYLTEYRAGELTEKTVIGALDYADLSSPTGGMIALVPDFDQASVELILTDDYAKYATSFPILEDVEGRESYGRAAVQIQEQVDIQYGSEQGLLALLYGKNGLETTSITAMEQGDLGEYNDFVYYVSFVFEK